MNCETTLKKIIQQKKIASDPVFDDKYLKTKTKSNKGRIHTIFNNKVPKEGSECICVSLIVTDSIFKRSKNYYLQAFFFFKFKYKIIEREKKLFIRDDLEDSSDDDSKEEDVEENSE